MLSISSFLSGEQSHLIAIKVYPTQHDQPVQLPSLVPPFVDSAPLPYVAQSSIYPRTPVRPLTAVVGKRGSLVEDVDSHSVAEALEVRLPCCHTTSGVPREESVLTPPTESYAKGPGSTFATVHCNLHREARAQPARS